jgi:fatty acid kinase fatty acid binding subunit
MGKVAIFTDSAADLPPDRTAAAAISVVPLIVSFGDEEFRAGIDITTDEFWDRLTAPGAPFPKTAAAAPGTFQEAFERAFAEGADSIVYVGPSEKLSATVQSARVAREGFSDREIHIIDSGTASMGAGLLVELAVELVAAGRSAGDVAAAIEKRRQDIELYVVLDTLEYLKRGGRISAARAAIGEVLSIKPIITVEGGVVEVADRVRTRSKARERLIELLTARPTERIAVLHGRASGIEDFAREIGSRAGVPAERVTIQPIGASVGPHVGPGAYGAVVLRQERAD